MINHKNSEVEEAEMMGELGYDPKYDAYYNTRTKEWLEEACDAIDCTICKNRPEKHGS